MKRLSFFIGMVLACAAIGFLSWKLERWINWKFDYGARVEKRIHELELRIEKLEKRS